MFLFNMGMSGASLKSRLGLTDWVCGFVLTFALVSVSSLTPVTEDSNLALSLEISSSYFVFFYFNAASSYCFSSLCINTSNFSLLAYYIILVKLDIFSISSSLDRTVELVALLPLSLRPLNEAPILSIYSAASAFYCKTSICKVSDYTYCSFTLMSLLCAF